MKNINKRFFMMMLISVGASLSAMQEQTPVRVSYEIVKTVLQCSQAYAGIVVQAEDLLSDTIDRNIPLDSFEKTKYEHLLKSKVIILEDLEMAGQSFNKRQKRKVASLFDCNVELHQTIKRSKTDNSISKAELRAHKAKRDTMVSDILGLTSK